MRSLIAAAIIGVAAAAPKRDREDRFVDWCNGHNKSYDTTQEYDMRMEIWEGSDDLVTAKNAEADEKDAKSGKGNAMRLKLNKFADQTDREMERRLLGRGKPRGRGQWNNIMRDDDKQRIEDAIADIEDAAEGNDEM